MQTRLQTKLAKEAAEAEARANAQAAGLSDTNSSHRLRSFDSMSSLSSVSTLTPTNSFSFSSSATPTPNLDAIVEAEDEEGEQDAEYHQDDTHVAPPLFPWRPTDRPMITPQPSLNPQHRYPAEVFQAPKKHVSPSERERLAAERARDSLLAGNSGLARLTEQGTLLLVDQPDLEERESSLSPEPSSDRGRGHGLGSPFVSQHAIPGPLEARATAQAYRRQPAIESIPTILVDPNTGKVLKYPVARE
ncbi:hypothetical protein FB45DRAFT_865071 [Roridomyces roridus]|uniref:Uncharacterized protein n=1 Tax=Roridomyces roridus TaxID=1738132 RepID=A0AAD7C2T0_9AGAR|nr:hypothetical protein FB45DRAFT_865071 [Roridomyces roridus]